MDDLADLNLVLAAILPQDALKPRAEAHLARRALLRVPFSVGVELLLVCRRFGMPATAAVGAAGARFGVENIDVLLSAAAMLDEGDVKTVFDALHVAEALVRGVRLHTADAALLLPELPTVGF